MEMTFDDWAEHVARSTDKWHKTNSLNMVMDMLQITRVNEALQKRALTPEQQLMTTDHKQRIEHSVFEGLYTWASEYYDERCPSCERSRVMIDYVDDQLQMACSKNCGWVGDRNEVLRLQRK